jgi:flagellar hook-length control protein FliK
MLSGSNNILDQLLGGFETTPFNVTGKPGQGTTGDSTGVMFGELLAGLMESGQLMSAPNSAQLSSCLFPSSDQPAAQDGAPAGQSSGNQSLIDQLAALTDANQPFVLFGAANLGLPTGVATTPTNQNNAVDPTASGDLTSLTGAASTVKNPVYNIIDFRIENGQVELTATTDQKPSEPIQITIPIKVLGEALAEKISKLSTQPVDLKPTAMNAGNTSPVRSLDSLLKASNLKTLTVSQNVLPTAATTDNAVASAPITATLVAENGGARFVITSKMTRQDLKISSRTDQDLDATLSQDDFDAEAGFDLVEQASPGTKNETIGMLPLRRSLAVAKFSSADRFSLDAKAFGSETDLNLTGLTADRTSQDSAGTTRTNIAPSVKFTLPETLQKSFASSGQTIMLKIEPDHLGPARLNLSVRDQMLTARVTVDTPVAKALVERSLDQLTETLSRAGIAVDKIEVMLGDSGAREQFFDRRPLWSQSRASQKSSDADSSVSDIPSLITPALLSRQYVGNSGVNVLA